MKRQLVMLLVLCAVAGLARADIPGHNPEVDGQCTIPGTQFSRKIAACGQAHCPPGANRTYTLACSCGEAWNKPFRTCVKDYLATHCVAKGASCDDTVSGFDPLTGGCKAGFIPGPTGVCVRVFDQTMRCRVEDLFGNPIANLATTLAEKTASGYDKHEATTDAEGYADFPLNDVRAAQIVLRAKIGDRVINSTIERDQYTGQCTLLHLTGADVERTIEDVYADTLSRACVGADAIAKFRDTKLDSVIPKSPPEYSPKLGTIFAGSLDGDWSELENALLHEYGHAMSETILDQSWGFFGDYPMIEGKFVGGAHDTWKPTGDRTEWTTPNIYGEQVAFEEGLADFVAAVIWADQGRDGAFAADQATDARAREALAAHPKMGSRIEGVVTRVLLELYADDIARGDTAKVLGDFIATVTYLSRTEWTSQPARTIQEFLAAKVRRSKDKTETGGACFVAGGDVASVASRFGLEGDGVPRAAPAPPATPTPTPADLDRRMDNAADALGNPAGPALDIGHVYSYEAGPGLEISIAQADYVRTGRIGKLELAGDSPVTFQITGAGAVQLDRGGAVVRDMSAVIPGAFIEHMGTSYVVKVGDGATEVAVGAGAVSIKGNAAPVVVEAGKGAIVTREGEVTPLDSAADLLSASAKQRAPSTGGASDSAGDSTSFIIAAAAGAFLLVAIVLWLALRGRRRR